MTDSIAIVGNIATEPRHSVGASGVSFTTFRVASTQRRFDKTTGTWVDSPPNWFTVCAYRALSDNAYASLRLGDRVAVIGRLRVRRWTDGDRSGTAVEIDADALGHDLRWGTTSFQAVRSGDGPAEQVTGVDPDGEAHDFAETLVAEPTPF